MYKAEEGGGVVMQVSVWQPSIGGKLGGVVKRRWADVVFPTFARVPSSSQPNEQIQPGLLGEDLATSPTCEVGAQSPEGLKRVLE